MSAQTYPCAVTSPWADRFFPRFVLRFRKSLD
jgi:hypothetical protein